jgi:isopenicillin N synthase-like dioxygenase
VSQPTEDDLLEATAIGLSEIPLIDFSAFAQGTPEDRKRIADEITHACETIGFFYLTGHGVPEALRANIFDRSAQFFHLPMEEKRKSRVTPDWNRGWIYQADQSKLDAGSRVFEQYRIQREFDPNDPDLQSGDPLFQPNRWPEQLPGFDTDCLAYYAAMSDLAAQLLEAMAIGLGLPEDRFVRYFQKPICQISLMYYPALPEGVGNEIKNLSAHTDEGPVVILAQDETGGLQVKNLDGQWLAAPPVPGAFTVNIGNMMMWWSNGRFKSTLHRVRNTSSRERFSVPFFWNADPEVVVEPLPELVERDKGVVKYPPVHVGQLMSRFYTSKVHMPYDPEAVKPAKGATDPS